MCKTLRIFAPTAHAAARIHADVATVAHATVGFDIPRPILRGHTHHFKVYYDGDLGESAIARADGVLASCEADYSRLRALFGGKAPDAQTFDVIITNVGTNGGAYHGGCGATQLYCSLGSTNAEQSMLMVAELDEVFEDAHGGWDCGHTNGEALSIVLAQELHPAAFGFASHWLNSSRQDFVSTNDAEDRDVIADGCGVLFLYWLRYQIGFTFEEIIAAGGDNLADTYRRLTGASDAFAQFNQLMSTAYPGRHHHLATDNPFPQGTLGYQANWWWCNKCGGLGFIGAPTNGRCAGGGQHDHTGSSQYRLAADPPGGADGDGPTQSNWRWCRKCEALSFGGIPRGVCPAGDEHDHTGSGNYALLMEDAGADGQPGWLWCRKCQMLVFEGSSGRACPAGHHHDHTGSGKYKVRSAGFPVRQGQGNWRRCRKCHVLAFAANPDNGVCKAGDRHDHTGSGNYTLPDVLASGSQPGWRWCRKCEDMTFAGNGVRGPCAAGDEHEHGGSAHYSLPTGPIDGAGQSGWRWCHKCQATFFAAGGPCARGGVHDGSQSGDYVLG
jgi:hypothetical protein